MIKNISSIILLCLVSLMLNAQSNNNSYEKNWKKVDSLITKKGLTQSALQEVNNIYALAKKEKNDAQLIKALLYKMNLQEATREDAVQKNIKNLEEEINNAQQPAKSILTSILAETYWNYFQQNRYNLYDRTNTTNFKKEDIATWTIDDFHKKISALYLSSVNDEKLLQQTKLQTFDAIIIKGNARYLRPTLYDLLTHRALEYFKSDESDINKPAYAFEIDNAEAFAAANVFAQYHFVTKDSASLHFKALLLFQQLLLFHIDDIKPDALIDADIERIEFVKQYSTTENKDELYNKALENITTKYAGEPAAAEAWYLQALQYSEKAANYDPLKDTTNRYAYALAKAICEKVIQQKDSSEGKSNCQTLLHQILHKELSMQTEKINVPDQPFRTLINYRNFSALYFRVIKIDRSTKENPGNNKWQDDYWKKLLQLPAVKNFSQQLPQTNDYQKHAAEIKIDALPVGEYALLASVSNDFILNNNPWAVQYFYVSNIAYINNGSDYFVLNRESGQPLARTNVQAWYRYYDNKQNSYLERKGETFITDKNGSFTVAPPKVDNNNTLKLEFTSANDHLFIDNNIQFYNYRTEDDNTVDKTGYEKDNLKTFFFTDRAIYRPAQTVYFKGIVITKDFDSKQSKIRSHFTTKVILYNANEEKVDSLSVTTNDFGSYNGKFTLPENLLNGEFKIADDSSGSEQSFSVEEYKRPKFYVEYEKLKGSYRINDTIKITGSAKAYAGNNIDGASVKYRVTRQARYPYPWLYWRWGSPRSSSQEIAHGEIKTNADGKFNISFAAIPDKSINKQFEPVFEYQIAADITDINGETRSGETTVPVGYKALNLSIALPFGDNIAADSLKNIFIKTENLSGEFEPAKVNVSVYKLKSPERLIRERYWPQPDQFVISKEEYLKNFPYDEYSDETKKESWEKINKVFEKSDSTKEDSRFKVQGTSFQAGWYLIEANAKDKYGEDVKNIKYIQLYDTKTGSPANPQYNWVFDNYEINEPGKKATVNIGSSAHDLFVIEKVERGNKNGENNSAYSFFNLNNEKKSVDFDITENDRGGFGVFHAFIKNNRFYTSSNTVNVPWTNKELNISYETYRDKTLPGSEEKWTVKISGYKKDKVAAEVLASMYDASLDQFKKQDWSKPDIFSNYYAQENWNGENNFSFVQSQQKYFNGNTSNLFIKTYDKLLNSFETRQLRIRGMASMASPQMLQGRVSGVQINNNKRELNDVVITALGVSKKKELINGDSQEYSWANASTIDSSVFAIDKGIGKISSNQSGQLSIQIRKNFNETAFFFPDLKTDSSGNISFSFTMPEALTQWKWMTLAHTKDLSFGYSEKTIITQKELMVQPNTPRFLREGDHIDLSTKIVNLTDSEMSGQAELQLFDATTNEPVDGWFQNMQANQYFTVGAKQSGVVVFPIQIPYQFDKPLTYKIIAHAPLKPAAGNNFSDGEETTLPVLSNRMLVTESLPLNMRGNGTKNFKFEKLLQSGNSETLNHHSFTVEFTSNPAWYAVQALPYLMEYPYECAEQTFNRFYANALASKIINSSPRIKAIFEKWKTSDTSALLSNLQKNQELKSVLLQETPWVLEAKTEAQQKKNIALLFDMAVMSRQLESAITKLQDMQTDGGGFVWFKGGPDDRYITQYILTGIGHLKKLNALPPSLNEKLNDIIKKALSYLDKKIKEDYNNLVKHKLNINTTGLGYAQIQYLYMRSFFSDYALPGESFTGMNYFRKQSQQAWLLQNKFMQGMIALSLFRTGDVQKAKDILASLKQNAIVNEEAGMYWKDVNAGYYWQQAPVETQSLLIEAFTEINKDTKTVNDLKTWLLKQKQTQNWKTTKATADACYALLLQGTDWIANNSSVEITTGDKVVINSNDANAEAGTGYIKKTIDGPFVNASMGNISVSVSSSSTANAQPSWGSAYWQYFENLDKITPASTPLLINKKLFVEKNTDRGLVLDPVIENSVLKVGDKIKVRIEIKVDRDMEYVHMKDMRASCMEPVNVLSEYKYQGGLGYYETTKDASTNFFFSWLPKGTYVFEYPLFVTNTGNFSNGITTIECMYAPEFTAHSDGVRVNVQEK
jgi:alpha-2-macroglobulin-like protein/alpha-2-macroglobulin family protein/MG2 domain-containing protein